MLAVAMIIYADRKIWAAIALRRGPNVVGPWGLLQSFADGLKVFLKETIIPTSANKGLFLIAPIITFTVALIVWAVIPFEPGVVLADINVGLLYVLAASLARRLRRDHRRLGVQLQISLLLRAPRRGADGQLRSLDRLRPDLRRALGRQLQPLRDRRWRSRAHVLGLLNGFGFNPLLFPMAVVFLISSMAETFRAPFDLAEAESELVAGYQTEYSSMSFALFWLGEYANVLLMCALNAMLFWGGWLPPLDWAPLYCRFPASSGCSPRCASSSSCSAG